MKILIVGGSGGIGSALIRSCLDHYPECEIIATYNNRPQTIEHPRVQWKAVDITIEQDIQDLAEDVGALDLLINAVGFLHSESEKPEKTINHFSADFFYKNMRLNTLPSIFLAKHFFKALKSGHTTHFCVLSAKIGSLEDNKVGGWLSYRASKTALNMAMKTVAIEWKRKLPNCCLLLFHPGTTDTTLTEPFKRNIPEAQINPASYAADSLLALINSTTEEDSGKFMSHDGSEIAW